jgi:hypothetical protein
MSILLVVALYVVSMHSMSQVSPFNLQSRMIAMAINIIKTWWYPRNGINPKTVVSFHSSGFQMTRDSRCMLTANCKFAIVYVCLQICDRYARSVLLRLPKGREMMRNGRQSVGLGFEKECGKQASDWLCSSCCGYRNARYACVVDSSWSFGWISTTTTLCQNVSV